MVIVIITVVARTISFFLRFVRLASCLNVFRWLGTFCNKMIFRSSYCKMSQAPKDSKKIRKSDKSKEKGNRAKDNSDDYDDLKVYASMAKNV